MRVIFLDIDGVIKVFNENMSFLDKYVSNYTEETRTKLEEEKNKFDVYTKEDYKRFFCDIVNMNYHTDNNEILNEIKKLIE